MSCLVIVFVFIIDGLLGLGKGIISWLVVEQLGWCLFDLGVLYCVVGYVVGVVGLDLFDVEVVMCCVQFIWICFQFFEDGYDIWVLVNGYDVIDELCIEMVGVVVLVIVLIFLVCQVFVDF